MSKEVIINSYPRTGNTFMLYAMRSAYELNNIMWNDYPVISHTHSKHMQRLKNDKGFYQVSIVRNPIDAVSSYVIHSAFSDNKSLSFNENVVNITNHCLNVYSEFYLEWLFNKNARMIDFNKLKNDTNDVVSIILKDLDIDYSNKINPDYVLKTLKDFDIQNNSGIQTGHTPRMVEILDEYQIVKDFITNTDKYTECLSLYKQILEAIN